MDNQLTPDLEKGSSNQAQHVDASSIHKVHASDDGSFVQMGPYKFRKDELMNAFGGTLQPGIHPVPPVRIGNPAAMGLASFAFCSFMISMFHLEVRGIQNQNILAGAFFFYGGLVCLVSGVMCYIQDATFAGTALSCFAGFWLSYGATSFDAFGIKSTYASTEEFTNAMGLFLITFDIFAFVMFLCTLKATWPFFTFLLFIVIWIMLLAIGTLTGSTGTMKAGGVFGCLCSFNSLYLVWAAVASNENSYITPRPLLMPHAPRV